jgi:uncharacterized membrane protein YcaP (DUF421 family)
MWYEWLGAPWSALGLVLLTTVLTFVLVLVFIRITGLRSFSKMSSFDFAMTIAVGTVLASTSLSRSVPLAHAAAALLGLFGTQTVIAVLRQRAGFGRVVDNDPVLVMVDGRMLHDRMRRVNISASDIRGKLREANVLQYSQVRAVVFETTGDVSVLHGHEDLDPDLLQGVDGVELLTDR